MKHEPDFSFDRSLSLLDMESIEDASNKVPECSYFLELAESESDRNKFRWLISAFLNAAYSYFEMRALHAHHAFTIPETGETIEDSNTLRILDDFVSVSQSGKKKLFIKTEAKEELIKKLYELRRGNTHHFPLAITTAGNNLPDDYLFGRFSGSGLPCLSFCREILTLITRIENTTNE